MGRHHGLPASLSSRLTLAFVLLVALCIGAVFGLWRLYRAATFEAAASNVLVAEVRAALVLAEAAGGDAGRLDGLLAAAGFARETPPPAVPVGVLGPLIARVEARASAALGFPIRLQVRTLPPRRAWVHIPWQTGELVLGVPLDEWEGELPTPVLLGLAVILLVTLVAAALAVVWLQGPLGRVSREIAAQGGRVRLVDVPPGASREVSALVAAYNRVVAEIHGRDREREELLAGVSHDLKAPLARLRMRMLTCPDEATVAGVVRDVAALDAIAEQFLGFVRSSGEGEGEGARQVCLLGAVVEGVLDTPAGAVALQVSLGGAGNGDRADLAAVRLAGDATVLTRILMNLLDNAREYGEPPVTLQVRVGDPAWVELAVADQGPGMDDATLARACQPFVRLDPARGRAGHCGLGLAIVTRLVQAAGAQLRPEYPATGGFALVVRWPRSAGV